MAHVKLKSEINIDIKIKLELTIGEAIALNEITKYGSKAFLEGYYKQLGRSYLQPYEKSVVSLFGTIGENLPPEILKANKIIKSIEDIGVRFKLKES